MREYKGESGIYCITNIVNGKKYIGKTKCFYTRYCQYASDVRSSDSNRINNYLLNSFLKYGFDNFKFDVIEFCPVENCSERELYWMIKFDTINRDVGYNLRMDSSTGMITHELTSKKISERLKDEWSKGVRKDHGTKLKASWKFRDRNEQSKLMSRNLTKYVYDLYYEDREEIGILYKELQERGLSSVIGNFHRRKSDEVICKGVKVIRRKLNESKI